METRALLLTNSYMPHKVVSLERAVSMLFLGKIEVVEEYNEILGTVHEARLKEFPLLARAYKRRAGDELGDLVIRMPAVAILTRAVGSIKRGVKFSRVNVFTRDRYECQYCGEKKKSGDLNYDHVVPRHQGGKTHWGNIVTACYKCNGRKANRTPEQAGMKLRKMPTKPMTLPIFGLRFDPAGIPQEWLQYCTNFFNENETAA